jgi:cellulose synthase operon protein C
MSSTQSAPPPDPAIVTSTIGRLRAEHAASGSTERQAILLHEVGVLEERLGDEAAAARDQLAAVNAEPEFSEPLERLLAIIERRQSYKNLGKLLDRLHKIGTKAEERARALIDQAALLADQEQDHAGARELLERAAEELPDDPSIQLMLELCAVKIGDQNLREQALQRRAELARAPEWKALLLADLAELRFERADTSGAFEALAKGAELRTRASYLLLTVEERFAQRSDQPEREAAALEAQAGLILEALLDPLRGDELGVPHGKRNAASCADLWLRASDAHRQRGELAQATALLDRALAELPGDPLLSHARAAAAEVSGDTQTIARLASAQLEAGAVGELAAALWLRVAEASASEGDGSAALAAVGKALQQDPNSIPARALELDLLSGAGNPAALASSLEAAAERLSSDRGKADFFLLSADVYAREAQDNQGARAALSQASMLGATPSLVARIARLLASLTADGAWYEEASRRLLSQGATADEQVSLWFELLRARCLRGDRVGSDAAAVQLAEAPGGGMLGQLLLGYVLELTPDPTDAASLRKSAPPSHELKPWSGVKALAALESDPARSRALRIVVALRALTSGEPSAAVEELTALHADETGDVVVAAALSWLHQARGNASEAARVLAACAASCDDPELGASFNLTSGILSHRAGNKAEAIDRFESAAEVAPRAGGALLSWALRAAEPDSLDARRRALEGLEGSQAALGLLERFGLELGRGGNAEFAADALSAIGESAPEEVLAAADLARGVFAGAPAAERSQALERLGARSAAVSTLTRAAEFDLVLEQAGTTPPNGGELELAASRWVESDAGLAPAIEWLGAAIAKGDARAEVAARRELAARVSGLQGEALAASASMVAALAGVDGQLFVEGSGQAAALANLELALPGVDPRRRAAALLGASGSLGDDNLGMLLAMAGYNQLAFGDLEAAQGTFRAVVEILPDEIIGWEGLRSAALALNDRATLAEACAALGDAVADSARGAELWETAAGILLDEIKDAQRGEFALARAVDRDVSRFAPFDRLFRLVRARKESPRLLDLVARRLEVAEDPDEIAKLFWERARVLRETGDRPGALAALENVRLLEPDHVGALALSGEIYLSSKMFPEAAEHLSRLSGMSEAPTQQRLMSGVAAVDIYENKLHDIHSALRVLLGLHGAGLSTLPVRERLARVAAKAQAWREATAVLEQLMQERESSAGRAEAARLCLAIYRDKLQSPEAAEAAIGKLLEELPDDAEALDFLLGGVFSPAVTLPKLASGLPAVVRNLVQEPFDTDQVDRLARLAEKLGNTPLRQAALGALVALGVETGEIDPELRRLDERVARLPSTRIDEGSLPELADPEDKGPIAELFRELASTIAEALGPSLVALGVTKKERVDARAGLPVRNEIAAWAGALGIGEFELYIGGKDPHAVCAVASELPAIVLGSAVSAPLLPQHRQAVARELFALRRGTSVLRHRDPSEIAALTVAACKLAGVDLPGPAFAMLGEFQRQLGKEMPRRVRKVLPELAARIQSSRADTHAWYRAATSSLDRMAALAAGDVSWVLCEGNAAGRGHLGASVEAQERAKRLLSFVLSPPYLSLREKLGMGLR